jgi:hypothetical protein
MRKLMNAVVVALVAGPALVLGQAGDVNKVLADMRAALGGADRVAAVKALSAVGKTARTNAQGATTEGDLELAMELPDKYVTRSVVVNMGTMSVYRNAGFNGNGVINEVENPPNLSGGGGMIMIRTAGEVALGQQPTPEQKAANDQRLLMASKKDFARMTVGMFGSSYEAFPLEFSYAGQADSPDGKAHVITVKGADNFDAKLFVDTKTSLPLMLTWSDKEPMQMIQNINRGGGPGGGQTMTMGGGGATFRGGQPPTEEEIKKMQADMAAREAARKVVEYRIYYSNFKAVNGVLLPHTLQRSIDGKPTEETTFEQIKINPKIDKQKFAVSK